ncbi:hypothetical protein DN412_02735 [Cupriavidus lacunae]|uniref:Uncharacterized protein n=2 Tax=Cupriavidus lacunae TaxID=2666307 RepID=A0A370P1V1_9BURK|nr:hypothetical protein DN412_02735 [Cupriavidus lacunae]
MESDGAMPMSRTGIQSPPTETATTCHTTVKIHSKSALAALMGPPIITEQDDQITITPPTPTSPARIDGHAVVNASGRYGRLYGTTSSRGEGVFDYAGQDLREGATLGSEFVESSLLFTIYARDSGEEIGKLYAPHATLSVSGRQVGRRQTVVTAMGRKQCVPITYERRTWTGPLQILDETVNTEPHVMHVTDWYCPSEGFVLRTDIVEDGKTQRIDTTEVTPLNGAQGVLGAPD